MPGKHLTPDFSDLEHLLIYTRRLINTSELLRVISKLPNEIAAASRLSESLRRINLVLRSTEQGRQWRLYADNKAEEVGNLRDALFGLARLIETDGWKRIKTCNFPECGMWYLDQSNGTRRKYCDHHKSTNRWVNECFRPPRERRQP